ncbi:MAG: MBL fold metallo-hydrolase [Patescibacteria group bacterium]|jgi:L-ascorbate metabolism protein UlaG (beta-lactamase superfamily)
MHINWLGLSCFKIQTKGNTIITDPYGDKTGLTMPKQKADVVLLSDPKNDNVNNTKRLIGDNFLIDGPGEYELKEDYIYGLKAGETDQTGNFIFRIESEEISLGFLGVLNHSLTDAQLETMEGVDVLFLPVSSLTSERRTKIISQIEPRIVIPMYHHIPKLKLKLENVEKFAKEMGIKNIEAQDKLILKKKDLPQEETKVIFLKNSN